MDLQAMGANVKMAETMGATSKVMANMNKMMNQQINSELVHGRHILHTHLSKTDFLKKTKEPNKSWFIQSQNNQI